MASRSVCAGRTWPQITHQAETTNSKTEEGTFQGDERGDSEKAQSRDRTIAHASANSRRHVSAGFDKFPNQQGIGHVHKEEDRRVEGNRRQRKSLAVPVWFFGSFLLVSEAGPARPLLHPRYGGELGEGGLQMFGDFVAR